MKSEATISLSAALLALVLMPNVAMARDGKGQPAPDNTNQVAGQGNAAHMVPAQAIMLKTLDAKKIQQGEQFEATLSGKVKLKDGSELPRGTVLVGTVVADDMHQGGNSTLSLRFTQARLKDGKTIAVKAAIVGVFPAGSGEDDYAGYWTPTMVRVDAENVMSGVDLHSNVNGDNSGDFVAAKKNDVKLSEGSQFALAIEAQQDSTNGSTSGN